MVKHTGGLDSSSFVQCTCISYTFHIFQ